MGARLWRMVEEFRDSQPFPPSMRAIARQAGIAESTFANWQNISKLPEPAHLRAFSQISKFSYQELLDAALADAGYTTGAADGPAKTRAGSAGHQVKPLPKPPTMEDIEAGRAAAHRSRPKGGPKGGRQP